MAEERVERAGMEKGSLNNRSTEKVECGNLIHEKIHDRNKSNPVECKSINKLFKLI